MKKLLVIDGNSILNRAFYGVRPLTTKDGFPTNALYGMVTMVTRQFDALSPDYCAVAFDLKAPTFRHRIYDAYKAGRRPMPEELKQQLPVAKDLMRALGYTVLELEGYEADDILGTLAQTCNECGVEAYLMTGDRDSLQLISERVHVLLATNAETIDMDETAFQAKYGVASSQFVDVKALMGDSSDNIPGVPGIGEKTALRLIAEHGSLDGVYADLPTANLTPSVRSKLEAGKDSAYLSKELATICRSVPLKKSIEDLAVFPNPAEAKALFLRLEFSGFLKRFDLVQEASDSVKGSATLVAETKCVDADRLKAAIEKETVIAMDWCEDRLSFATRGEILCYDGDFCTVKEELAKKLLVVYDCKSLYKVPALEGLGTCRLFDLMLGAYLANSSKSNYDLSTVAIDFLGDMLPEQAPRVSIFLASYDAIVAKLNESGQFALLEEMEIPLAKVLSDMERAGFCIDREGIASYGNRLSAVAHDLEERIFAQAGHAFNINSPKQLGDVLFEELGLPHGKKTKSGYSTNAEILEKLSPYHEIVADILEYRQVTKLKSTYVDGLLKVADENGRVHTTFKQTGTATGRLSSTEPNLQNIPIRSELGRELRRYFLPKNKDSVLIDADYSQIELRLMAHISKDENMIRAFRSGADIHTSTAATVFGVPMEEVTPAMRKKAKAVNFGIIYGIGAFSLADDLGISRVEAQKYIDQYLAGFPGVADYLQSVIKLAYENGFVTTSFGRKRYIPELSGKNKVLQKFGERVAMNSPIQGTAADLIKIAMIRVHKRLEESRLDARLILQVHDELLIEASRKDAPAAERILREEMEQAANLSVPLTVEIHTAENWFDAH